VSRSPTPATHRAADWISTQEFDVANISTVSSPMSVIPEEEDDNDVDDDFDERSQQSFRRKFVKRKRSQSFR
jgi:hypothetical protein